MLFFNGAFGFVIVIVALGITGNIIKRWMKSKERNIPDELLNSYEARLKRLEERMANLETIVLEHERDRKFSSL
ncbi:MAG: hypothetical protein GX846_11525 [Deltaproteobacteria bacterium]|nr:hypothetical protein [Deltaproteobacteria bacterium]